MKQRFIFSFLAFLGAVCPGMTNAQYSYMGGFDFNGRPSYLVSPSDTIDSAFLTRIVASLPESYDVPTYNPNYLTNTPSDLAISQTSDVWITFVSEGATYLNALGYYTFPTNAPLSAPPADSDIHVIFPNVNYPGAGGDLNPGNKVYLGQFPANTTIGFVLMADAFHYPDVDSALWVLYSNPLFNPEADTTLKRHNILLLDTPTNKIVLGFEDIRRDLAICDQDFNDAVFYLTINPFGGAVVDSMPYTVNPGDTSSSGGTGGLESESLCGLASKRDFDKMKNSVSKAIDYSKVPVYQAYVPSVNGKSTGASRLNALVPANLENDFVPRVTSPYDLVDLTNASDILSVDYTREDIPKAVVLGITTYERPYSHTKAICDRFRGASLKSVDSIYIDGFKFVRYLLERENGELEYSIAFAASAKEGGNKYELQTNWLLSEYKRNDTVYNFQVWATLPHYSVKLVKDILNNLRASKPVEQVTADFSVPKAYIINGKRNKENLELELTNSTDIHDAKIVFEERVNENADVVLREIPITLNNGSDNKISIDIQDGYEYQGSLYLDGVLVDEVYFADGNWGLDYDNKYTEIKSYQPYNNPERVYSDDEFPVYRSLKMNVTSSDYITTYKSLSAGYESVDLTKYHTLKFYAQGEGDVDIRLPKDAITKWNDQFKTTITLTPEGKEYEISLDDFATAADPKEIMSHEDINSVAFTFLVDGGQSTDINFQVSNMAFSKKMVLSNRQLESKAVAIYPNPTNGNFTCSLTSEEEKTLVVNVTDITGKLVFRKEVTVQRGFNDIEINMPGGHLPTMMFVSIAGEGIRYETTKLIGK